MEDASTDYGPQALLQLISTYGRVLDLEMVDQCAIIKFSSRTMAENVVNSLVKYGVFDEGVAWIEGAPHRENPSEYHKYMHRLIANASAGA